MADQRPYAVQVGDVDGFQTPHHDKTRSKELANPEKGAEHVVFRISTLEPGGEDSWHAHEASEQLILVRSGTGMLQVKHDEEDDEVIEYDLTPETFVFLPAGTPHHGENTGDEPLELIVIWAPPYESFDEWDPEAE